MNSTEHNSDHSINIAWVDTETFFLWGRGYYYAFPSGWICLDHMTLW